MLKLLAFYSPVTTELSLRDFLDCFLCVLLLQRGEGEGRKGVGD